MQLFKAFRLPVRARKLDCRNENSYTTQREYHVGLKFMSDTTTSPKVMLTDTQNNRFLIDICCCRCTHVQFLLICRYSRKKLLPAIVFPSKSTSTSRGGPPATVQVVQVVLVWCRCQHHTGSTRGGRSRKSDEIEEAAPQHTKDQRRQTQNLVASEARIDRSLTIWRECV